MAVLAAQASFAIFCAEYVEIDATSTTARVPRWGPFKWASPARSRRLQRELLYGKLTVEPQLQCASTDVAEEKKQRRVQKRTEREM